MKSRVTIQPALVCKLTEDDDHEIVTVRTFEEVVGSFDIQIAPESESITVTLGEVKIAVEVEQDEV